MPYNLKRDKKGWAIVRSSDGSTVGHSATRAEAEGSIRARMAAEHNKKKKV